MFSCRISLRCNTQDNYKTFLANIYVHILQYSIMDFANDRTEMHIEEINLDYICPILFSNNQNRIR